MSGIGKRFLDANYKEPKPLIKVDGKPIIEHVCNLFSNHDEFIFICNSTHLLETRMKDILTKIKPKSTIVEISNHKKGPVYAVLQALNHIRDDEEIIINYCDFGTYWNYEEFLNHTRTRNADGAIPSYTGFHPHMLGSTNYAFIKHKNQWLIKIKEKEPFTKNRMEEYASNGTYYFKRGSYVKKYFKKLIQLNDNLNGEFYVSLVYNLMTKDKLKVSIYEIQHMLQWGTPSDLEEYNMWSSYFKKVVKSKRKNTTYHNSITLIPLAGKGSRFLKKGYKLPKPLIKVSGKPMIIQAANCLPDNSKNIFVVLDQHLSEYPLKNTLLDEFPDSKIVSIPEVTQGQAITCKLGLKSVDKNHSLLISASDNGIIYDEKKYNDLINDKEIDGLIFTFKNHVSSRNNPEMYGWVEIDKNNFATNVSVKVPISKNPFDDNAIVGTFWFRKVEYFSLAMKYLESKNIRVNGEFYVDSLMNILIKLKYKIKVFEVENYICWGTPDDFETFNYWQSYFHKTDSHPYNLTRDKNVNKNSISLLNSIFQQFDQKNK